MKVFGFIIAIIGGIMIYAGFTGKSFKDVLPIGK
jgi:hypothetical protein